MHRNGLAQKYNASLKNSKNKIKKILKNCTQPKVVHNSTLFCEEQLGNKLEKSRSSLFSIKNDTGL